MNKARSKIAYEPHWQLLDPGRQILILQLFPVFSSTCSDTFRRKILMMESKRTRGKNNRLKIERSLSHSKLKASAIEDKT